MLFVTPPRLLSLHCIGRTFPGHEYFQSVAGPGQCSLFHVLRAYASVDQDVGYCQGLSFVAGLLIMHVSTKCWAYTMRPWVYGCICMPWVYGCICMPWVYGCICMPWVYGCICRPWVYGLLCRPWVYGCICRPWVYGCICMHVHVGYLMIIGSFYCKSTNIRRISIFGYFQPGHVWPKNCFARFSVTVYTGGSSTGQKDDVAETGFSPGRPKFELGRKFEDLQ